MATITWEPRAAGVLVAGYGVPFMEIVPSGYNGASGRLTVTLDGTLLSSADVLVTARLPVTIPKATWDALDFTVDHTLTVRLVVGADSGETTYQVRRRPTPIGAGDSNRAAIESFDEFLDAREAWTTKQMAIAAACQTL